MPGLQNGLGALPNKPKDALELCKGNTESEIIYRVVFMDLPCKCSDSVTGGCVFCAIKARVRAGEPPTKVLEDYPYQHVS